MHGYIVQDHWCHIPFLLNVQHVFFRSTVDNMTLLIMNIKGGMKEEELISRLVCFGRSIPFKALNLEL
jgi:hypothetical protein